MGDRVKGMQKADNTDFLHEVLFSGKVNFYINEEVSQKNLWYWSQDNLHWYKETDGVVWDLGHTWTIFLWKKTVIWEHYLRNPPNSKRYATMKPHHIMH
jgi:hypothetical protein